MGRNETQIEPAGRIKVLKFTVGTGESQILTTEKTRSVIFEPDQANSDNLFLGETGLAVGTDAFPLYAGRVYDVNLVLGHVYAIADAASQVLWVSYLVDEEDQ